MAGTKEPVSFQATLRRAAGEGWLFLRLPQEASDQLPSRAMVSVEGHFGGAPFVATLVPDGEGGHWLKVKPEWLAAVGAAVGDQVSLTIAPVAIEPEPEVPSDLQQALEAAPERARETWRSVTPLARRDWVFWVVSAKRAETRAKRIEVAMDKMAKGNRRPCCFDRTGMYDKSLSPPVAEEG
ncbi:MAG: DUF1905 domain-containing protein [Fimbriimonadaceae bacterium]|nr:DUF1905 domain-containing protein [Fimbriimonadaceae bacterium]QYK58177.1 MAG: DUF1905 domain-containing protein [Fimbriimonadaceae bacterium]